MARQLIRPRGEEDLLAYGRLLVAGFGTAPDKADGWARTVPPDDIRLVVARGEIVAGTVLVPMGQYFGGRAVPLLGVAGVVVSVAHRRRGHAGFLMTECLRESMNQGLPLSALYASTQQLYRSVGYEPAGISARVEVPLDQLGMNDRGLAVRASTDEDRSAIVACYERSAALRNGMLARGPYMWDRVWRERDGQPVHGYVVVEGSTVRGYVTIRTRPMGDVLTLAHVTDVVAETAAVGRRLLTLLGDLGSVARRATLPLPPSHPLLALIPEPRIELRSCEPWLLRVTDVPAAFSARGYMAGVEGELELLVVDDTIKPNAGRWRVVVSGGHATVERGGRGRIRVSARGLGPLFSGYRAPLELAEAGLLEGGKGDLMVAARVLAGPTPWMPDMF